MNKRGFMVAVLVGVGCSALQAQTSWTGTSVADAFLAAGSPANPIGADLSDKNFGGAGTLAIAPASSSKGEFQSLVMFDLSPSLAKFDAAYGAGNWQITSITLTLASNFGDPGEQPNNLIFNSIHAGGFAIEWLATDSWTEGTGNPSSPGATGVNFDSLGTLLAANREVVETNTYNPPGDNVALTWTLDLTSGFLADAAAGQNVTFRFYATDSDVGYLFNARSFGSNRPLITVTAVPEPAAVALLSGGLAVLVAWRRRMV